MTKQELINKLEELITESTSEYDCGHDYGIRRAIAFAEKLDETLRPPEPKPLEIEKPVVPQFVADWYEDHKHDFEYSLYDLCFKYTDRKLNVDLHKWFRDEENKPFETLAMVHKFGYMVEGDEEK